MMRGMGFKYELCYFLGGFRQLNLFSLASVFSFAKWG